MGFKVPTMYLGLGCPYFCFLVYSFEFLVLTLLLYVFTMHVQIFSCYLIFDQSPILLRIYRYKPHFFFFSSRDATFSGGGVSCGEITTSVIINSKLKRLSKVVTFCKVMTFRLVKHVSYLIKQIHVFCQNKSRMT